MFSVWDQSMTIDIGDYETAREALIAAGAKGVIYYRNEDVTKELKADPDCDVDEIVSNRQ